MIIMYIITATALTEVTLWSPPAPSDTAPLLLGPAVAQQIHPILRTHYLLTLRETELALLAFSQKTCATIAAERGTTRNTIKTAYQQIYRKCTVHSRDELRRLLTPHLIALQAAPAPPD